MIVLIAFWFLFQLILSVNLVFPGLLYLLWRLRKKIEVNVSSKPLFEPDYAIIVTAYQFVNTLPSVINSILHLNYNNYLVYVVADNCDISELDFNNEKVVILRPPNVLGSNTRSHAYAINNFKREHHYLTIIDSDNLVDSEYINQLNDTFNKGYSAVQGLRAAKNLNGTIASLDAARDIYYHFYDGKLLYESGSSATLSGSGMAFSCTLYSNFLEGNEVIGAGFDKVLQHWIVKQNVQIAFNERAIVYDEKTSKPDQLVNQRSRWINTWFKYFKLGFNVLFLGIGRLSLNQILFGTVLLRPPLFIFLFLSVICLFINVIIGQYLIAGIWTMGLSLFVIFFFVSLFSSKTDQRIYRSLKNIPQFIIYQIISLIKSRNANKISVATKHYHIENEEPDNKSN